MERLIVATLSTVTLFTMFSSHSLALSNRFEKAHQETLNKLSEQFEKAHILRKHQETLNQ